MSFWKIVGGATLGVGAIAAAPFTGGGSLVGAATLAASLGTGAAVAGAVAAGTAGAVIGDKLSDSDKESGKREGEQKAVAEYSLREKALIKQFETQITLFKGEKEYWEFLIASVAVGMATANVDGNISKDELEQIDEFIGGLGKSGLPTNIQNKINNLRNNPPSFNSAINLVNQLDKKYRNYEYFESVIEVIAEADGDYDANERAFLEAFKSQKIA